MRVSAVSAGASRRLGVVAAALLLLGGGIEATRASGSHQEALEHWARVLERFVGPAGRVDFQALGRDRRELDAYLRFIDEVSPKRNPAVFPTREDRLAHYVNSYNALAMNAVLRADIPETLGGVFSRLWYFGIRSNQVAGNLVTLSVYKNEFIRRMRDPRVHFALTNLTASDPRLPRIPFWPGTLDRQLDLAARRFLAEARNVRVDHERRRVILSPILKEYEEDFLRDVPSLVAYVNRYRDPPAPEDYDVSFFDHDWTVMREGVVTEPARPPARPPTPEEDPSRFGV